MPYPNLSAVGDDRRHDQHLYTPSAPNYQENPVSSENDVSKHIKSLQARLGFARFKMKQGWETSTLLDVEQLWKQKQQKLINELPKPRFTQRDIIDKRVYIPSPGARHARAKKAKLVRTYSNPSSQDDGFFTSNNYSRTKQTLYFHHYNHQQHQQQKQQHQQQDTHMMDSSSSSDGEHANKYGRYIVPAPPVRNSLEYLSYAIAMTEADEAEHNTTMISSQPLPDISEIEPNLIEQQKYKENNTTKSDVIDELDIASSSSATAKEQDNVQKISPPSSPVTSAAKAIMMFVNSHTTNNKQ